MRSLSPDAVAALQRHDWPGNIRELENAVERSLLLAEGDHIELSDLPDGFEDAGGGVPAACGSLKDRVRSATRQIERDAIVETLELTGGNVTKAAQRLGLSRRGLQLKMRELGLGRG